MLDLPFNIPADEHGAIDGMRLSRALMRAAVDVLLPYVGHCPACLDIAFSQSAEDVLETMHAELKKGQENALLFTPGLSGADRQKAIAAHLAAKQDEIVELLTAGEQERCPQH